MSKSIYNPLNLNPLVHIDYDDMSDHGPTGYANFSFLGQKHTPETKRQMSKALKGNQRWLGRKHSPETKKKMSDSAKRRTQKRDESGRFLKQVETLKAQL